MEALRGVSAPGRTTARAWSKPCSLALAVAMALGLSACGGGGGGGGGNVKPSTSADTGGSGSTFPGGEINVPANGSLVWNTPVTGAINVVKTGDGVLTTGAANTYSGTTQVNAGSLYVNGDSSGAKGATSVASGATLGGFGIVGGDVSVAAGGTLAPGLQGGLGTFTIKGSLSLAPGSILNIDFSPASNGKQFSDLINVQGNLSIGGTLNMHVVDGGDLAPGVYRVINYEGSLIDNRIVIGTTPSAGWVVQTGAAQQVNVLNTRGMSYHFWDGDSGPKGNDLINGGNGTWEAGGARKNWTDASGAVNSGFEDNAFAVFQTKPGTVTVSAANGAINAAGLQFVNYGWVLQGDAIHLVASAADPTHAYIRLSDGYNAYSSATINNVLSGSPMLVTTGFGILTLGGKSVYTGGTLVQSGTLELTAGAALGTGAISVGDTGLSALGAMTTLQLDHGVSLSNPLTLQANGKLDNAGAIGGNVNVAVAGGTSINYTGFQVDNHDGGSIHGNHAAVENLTTLGNVTNRSGGLVDGGDYAINLAGGGKVSNDGAGSIIRSINGIAVRDTAAASTVQNTGGALIAGSAGGVDLNYGGKLLNDGPGSAIRSSNGFGVRITGWYGTITNTGGATISSAKTAVYLALGSAVTNGAGSTIETTSAVSGDCGTMGTCAVYVAPDTTAQGTGHGITFSNAGIVNGNVQLSPRAPNAVTLTAGGSIHGDLSIGTNADSWLTLQGSTGTVQRFSQAVTGRTTFSGDRITGPASGTWIIDTNDLTTKYVGLPGGTLQIGDGGTTGSLGNASYAMQQGSLVFNRSDTLAIAGAISGTGSVTQDGAGVLALDGQNTYAGDTTINKGSVLAYYALPGNVVVNAAGTLDGDSQGSPRMGLPGVAGNLANAGRVGVHGRDANIGGTYTQASTGTLAISLGSKLAVAGTATLNGGTLEITGADSGYVSSTHTPVLTATGGLTGTFGQLVKDAGVVFTASTIQYDANSAWLDTSGLNVTTAAAGNGVAYTPASMGSAQRVQGAFTQLNNKIAAGTAADVPANFVQAAGLFQQAPSLQAAQASLQSLSGQLHAASAAMTFESIDASSRALSDHFDSVLGKNSGFGMWTQSLNVGGDMGRTGYDGVGFQLNGWLVGSDRQIGSSGVAGFAFGQGQGRQQLDQAYDHNRSRSTEGMLYAGWLNGNWYTQGRIGFGHFQQDVSRQLLLGTSAQGVSTRYSGNYNVAYGESGLRFDWAGSRIIPFINVQYAGIERGGFAEQGAGGFGLRADAQTLDRWQGGAGLRASRHWNLSGGQALDFTASAQFRRTFASHGDAFDASFVGVQQWQPLVGIGMSHYSGVVDFGLNATLTAHSTLNLDYDYEKGQRDQAQMVSAHWVTTF
jgi:autotransporter-associated beta strand protein